MNNPVPLIDDSNRNASEFISLGHITDTHGVHTEFLKWNSMLVVLQEGTSSTGNAFRYQLEFPIEAISWLVDALENAFGKGPSEGGLPAGKFDMESEYQGERLYLVRGMAIGGPNMPGYELVNLSRKDHDIPDKQRFAMGDDFLFEQGLFDLFKHMNSII